MIKRSIPVLAVLLLGGTACASKMPSAELVDARQAYARASRGPAAQSNPAGLYESRQALEVAERKHDDDPGSAEEKHLSYLAHRKTLQADANGRTAMAQAQEQQAKVQYSQLQASKLAAAQQRIGDVESKVRTQSAQIESERRARADAEKRAKDALDRLSNFAAVKQDTRGMVITLSGSVLFETNKSELLPNARERLNQVADALKNVEGRSLVVEGHTDSTGSEDYNQQLSEKRARSVREYLVTRGVREDLIRAEGKGESSPVANNASTEGRANNRRVEIIVEDEGGDKAAGATEGQDLQR